MMEEQVVVGASPTLASFPPLFGSVEMKDEFYIAKDFTNLNHGSFGNTPKRVLNAHFQYQIEMETSPDEWFRINVLPKYHQSRKVISEMIGASDVNSVTMVENASVGINSIFRSYPYVAKKDKILYFNTAYGMVQKTLEFVHDSYDVEIVQVDLTFEDIQSQESIIKKITDFTLLHNVNNECKITIVVMCHIVCLPAIILPVKELVKFFKSQNIATVVDGAHAIGNIPLNVTDIDSDYYLTNPHKWLFAPKTSCLLWKNPNAKFHIHPTAISFGYTSNPALSFQKEFSHVGTRDYSSYLSLQNAIQYRQSIGGEDAIMKYNSQLASEIGELYAKHIFNTHVITGDERVQHGSMVNIKLPFTDEMAFWNRVQSTCLEKYRSYVVVLEFDGKAFCRISAQIYNTLEEYERIGRAFYGIAKEMWNSTTVSISTQQEE